jgi:hypothetical protein
MYDLGGFNFGVATLVYAETIGESGNYYPKWDHTVAHELGHQVAALDHSNGWLMAGAHAESVRLERAESRLKLLAWGPSQPLPPHAPVPIRVEDGKCLERLIEGNLYGCLHLEGHRAVANDVLIRQYADWGVPLTELTEIVEAYPASTYAPYCMATMLLSLAQEEHGNPRPTLRGVDDALRARILKLADERSAKIPSPAATSRPGRQTPSPVSGRTGSRRLCSVEELTEWIR